MTADQVTKCAAPRRQCRGSFAWSGLRVMPAPGRRGAPGSELTTAGS
ncbi:hypothetical protein ACFPRL_30975 [Pseudoclavibacter helvolus]